MDANQLPYIQKTMVSAFDLVSSKADMKNDIGLASEYDKFDIILYDSGKDLDSEITVSFSKFALIDNTNNIKLLAYQDIQPDKYGTPCAFWFKHLTLPEPLELYNKDCCFVFNLNSNDWWMCMEAKDHCIIKSRTLLKTMRQGCIDAAIGLELSPWDAVHGKEKVRGPHTEVTGDKDKNN